MPLNWRSAMAFENPHPLRRGNLLILQVENRGNQRVDIHLFNEGIQQP